MCYFDIVFKKSLLLMLLMLLFVCFDSLFNLFCLLIIVVDVYCYTAIVMAVLLLLLYCSDARWSWTFLLDVQDPYSEQCIRRQGLPGYDHCSSSSAHQTDF